MKPVYVLACVFGIILASSAAAQQNAATASVEAPFQNFGEVEGISSAVKCSVSLAPQSLFGVTQVKGTATPRFLVSELFSPFTVTVVNDACSILGSWTTSILTGTMTGIAYDTLTNNSYWAVRLDLARIDEFAVATGTPTGRTCTLPASGVWGPLCINDNPGGNNKGFVEDIAADTAFEIDLLTSALGCSFPNPDNTGSGAYGNGLDDAANPGLGADLVISHGTIAAAQVTGVSQTDCGGVLLYETWNLFSGLSPVAETFPNGIAEFVAADASIDLAVAGNATGNFFILEQTVGITDCQGKDGENVLYVNNRTGAGSAFQINLAANAYVAMKMKLPSGGGNGKFLVHLNAGAPSAGTITTLPAQLGTSCFPVLLPTATPSCIWNNIGKTDKVGASNYFGASIPNPLKAPTTFLINSAGDPTNMPAGTIWTIQGIILNPAGSSPKAASVTNGIQLNIQ